MGSRVAKTSWLVGAALLASCAPRPPPPTDMAAAFRNVSARGFQLQTIAPTDRAAAYSLCKAAWFAQKERAATIGLGTPLVRPASFDGWMIWLTDVTIDPVSAPSPEFRIVDVASTAAACRQAWAWYR